MNSFVKALTGLATLAFAVNAGSAGALELNLKSGSSPKLKAKQVQLGIISPDSCPGEAKLTAWVHTNTTGTVSFMLVRKSGKVYGPYTAEAVKGSGGTYLATYSRNLQLVSEFYDEYRVVVPGANIASNWVSLEADC